MTRGTSIRLPVALSLTRTSAAPVATPGVITFPAMVAPSSLGSVTVLGRAAGAVTTTAFTVLPASPARFGSTTPPSAGGGGAAGGATGPPSAGATGCGANAGTGGRVTLAIPTNLTAAIAESPGAAVRAAWTLKTVPAAGCGLGAAADRIVAFRPPGAMVTPAGEPTSVQVNGPAP